MKRCHYIALDVHCPFTEMAVVTQAGRLTQRQRHSTTIPELVRAIEAVPRPRVVVFEEDHWPIGCCGTWPGTPTSSSPATRAAIT